jgi:hypothetical protein
VFPTGSTITGIIRAYSLAKYFKVGKVDSLLVCNSLKQSTLLLRCTAHTLFQPSILIHQYLTIQSSRASSPAVLA